MGVRVRRYAGRKMNVRLSEQTWQSWLVVAMVAPWCAAATVRYAATSWSGPTQAALGISLGLALLVFLARAATPPGALMGGIISAVLTLGAVAWYHSALPALLALFVLTWAATRFGRAKKQGLGVAEDKRGRNAAQVAANLGVAGLAAALALTLGKPYTVMVIAALAEATADTLASELGAVLGGPPLLLTNLRRVAPGTDGAISLAGTVAGTGGAVLVVLVAVPTLGLRLGDSIAASLAAVGGMFVDSLLGATAERAGGLNNDAVNFLSTLAASLIAALILAAGR
jgi:uncharacterized protein (TIGR00297 family)